jgi:cyclomaltodextrinase / maltogenic alpha-amylase / neopullulanase
MRHLPTTLITIFSTTMKRLFLLLITIAVISLYACDRADLETAPVQISTNPPEWSYNASIYEVNVRQFSEEGTFEALRRELPRLREMGVDIIWLMPVHPIGGINRKGTLGSYYSVQDYYGINPEFGTKDDFARLVEAIHAEGMYVLLDWVANHTAWDNPIAESNPEYFETDENGRFMPPHGTDWDDVIQLDYENPDVWTYMTDALAYWVEEFNIDGYRCDVAYLVPTPFWNQARAALDRIKPVFMLAEADLPELHEQAFDMSYDWKMHSLMNRIAAGEAAPDDLEELIDEQRDLFPPNAFRMQFTSNHDENSWAGTVFERLGEGAKTFAVLAATIEGMPLVYNGQEAGLDKRLEFFEKDPIEWKESPFEELYARLLNLKSENRALWNGEMGGRLQRIQTDRDDSVFAFIREMEHDKVFVVLNLTAEPADFSTDDARMYGRYTSLFSGEAMDFTGNVSFSMNPWEYGVFVK